MNIGREDIFWNYAATFLKIASSALLIPFILRMMSSEMVGIWSIFMTIASFGLLLDFGFNPSFTRNVAYIYIGVSSLKAKGFESVVTNNQMIDYGLLKGVINAMRWFYFRMAMILFLLLSTLGTYYIYSLLRTYEGNHQEVYIAWLILCVINTYNLFTLYYEALLLGKGLVKTSKKIVIVGQGLYLITAVILIILGYGLIAIVSAQASSVLVVRWLSHRKFFDRETKNILEVSIARSASEILRAVFPISSRVGLSALSGFMVQRSAIVVGSLYLTLDDIASYAISMQLLSIIAALAGTYIATYYSNIAQLRVATNSLAIKKIYLKGQSILFLTFLVGGLGLIFVGSWALSLIGSKTHLMSFYLLILATLLVFEQTNLMMAGSVLLTKNEVPFFKAGIISGIVTVTGMYMSFEVLPLSSMTMLAVPLIVDICYQTWKWPLEVSKDLGIGLKDILSTRV